MLCVHTDMSYGHPALAAKKILIIPLFEIDCASMCSISFTGWVLERSWNAMAHPRSVSVIAMGGADSDPRKARGERLRKCGEAVGSARFERSVRVWPDRIPGRGKQPHRAL
jgi:hypothetical protein